MKAMFRSHYHWRVQKGHFPAPIDKSRGPDVPLALLVEQRKKVQDRVWRQTLRAEKRAAKHAAYRTAPGTQAVARRLQQMARSRLRPWFAGRVTPPGVITASGTFHTHEDDLCADRLPRRADRRRPPAPRPGRGPHSDDPRPRVVTEPAAVPLVVAGMCEALPSLSTRGEARDAPAAVVSDLSISPDRVRPAGLQGYQH